MNESGPKCPNMGCDIAETMRVITLPDLNPQNYELIFRAKVIFCSGCGYIFKVLEESYESQSS